MLCMQFSLQDVSNDAVEGLSNNRICKTMIANEETKINNSSHSKYIKKENEFAKLPKHPRNYSAKTLKPNI